MGFNGFNQLNGLMGSSNQYSSPSPELDNGEPIDIGFGNTISNALRLCLQSIADNEGTNNAGIHSPIAHEAINAVKKDFLIDDRSQGWLNYHLTDKGRATLKTANESLGHAATRYAYKTRFFPGCGETPYDAAVLIPLTTPVRRVMDCVCF